MLLTRTSTSGSGPLFLREKDHTTSERAEAGAEQPGAVELVLTRPDERDRLITAAQGLRFLVLDELHTYRGRQGADVAMLVRRLRDACAAEQMQCVGTSATMTSEGSEAYRRREVAKVATRLFGIPVAQPHVIGETLQRATQGDPDDITAITSRVRSGKAGRCYEELAADPLAAWVESQFGVVRRLEDGRLVRRPRPSTIPEAGHRLAELTDETADACAAAIQTTLRAGAALLDPRTQRPVLAFRLHHPHRRTYRTALNPPPGHGPRHPPR
jgi:hypothetical protein